ncbi:MAG: hypothetical protein QOE93_16, partial [Actinomycetota bacterium]|nr:hypothetical protein [Actinomycetota bacterium]
MGLSASEKADVARRLVVDVFGGGDTSVIDELIDPGLVDHNTFPGVAPGKEGFGQAVAMVRGGFPDLHCEPVRIMTEGDTVLYHWEGTATHAGTFAGVPATGKPVRLSGIEVIHFGDSDKVVEHWIQVNALEVMQQLGVVPGATPGPWGSVPEVDPGRATTPEENKRVMVRHVEEIWNNKDLDAADELFHPQSVTPYAPLPPGPMG